MRAVPPQPSGRMGVAADLFVACRRRCSGIDSSSLRDLGSQAPPAKEHLFLGQDTSGGLKKPLQYDIIPLELVGIQR